MTRHAVQRRKRHVRSPLSRRCYCEGLEDRSLLASSTLTVITHGFTGFVPEDLPEWVPDMRNAIAQRGVSDFILFNWTEMSGNYDDADSNEVAGRLYTEISGRLLSVHGGSLDMHFIGHSRGAFVNMEVLRRLGTDPLVNRLGFVHMTTLDPHPLGDDGELEANPGGIVDFADNYYQTAGGLTGEPITGTLNFNLTSILAGWNGRHTLGSWELGHHSEVHDWYHWTIDTKDDNSPRLTDEDLPKLNTSLRGQLYGSLVTDLNVDGNRDGLESGAKIGYYFSVLGGGVGRVVLDADGDIFTVDVRSGTAPLYLGKVTATSGDSVADIAYSPQGELYVVTRANKVFQVDVRFEGNQPVLTLVPFAFANVSPLPTVSGLGFQADGTFFFSDADRVTEVRRNDPFVGRGVGFTSTLQSGKGDLVFDHTGYPYLAHTHLLADEGAAGSRGELWHMAKNFLWFERATLNLPFTDGEGVMIVNGMLYVVRPNKVWHSVNLGAWQLGTQGSIAQSRLTTVVGATALVSLAQPVWHNPRQPIDVNDDDKIEDQDALLVINRLIEKSIHKIDPDELFSFFCDVNNDGSITPLDALLVINKRIGDGLLPQTAAAAPTAATAETTSAQRQQALNAAMQWYAQADEEELGADWLHAS